MVVLQGRNVSGGTTFGRLFFYERVRPDATRRAVRDTQAELARFEAARGEAVRQLEALCERARGAVGEDDAMIFEIHRMMLEDLDFCELVGSIITAEGVNAEYAVDAAGQRYAREIAALDDVYLSGRAADVTDVAQRLIDVLCGVQSGGVELTEPAIVAADDLSPSETVQLDREKILAFITRGGSEHSHTAILAHTMGIPAVVGLGEALLAGYNGCEAAVDGFSGTVYIEPDEAVKSSLHARLERERAKKRTLAEMKGLENVTRDGVRVELLANIGRPSDMEAALENDAGGVGLFRSEFLYLESADYPTEEQQLAAYRAVLEAAGERRVVIRTLDIGADKTADYFALPREENPALGLRAVRLCLARPEVFCTQLRALYRASAHGNLAILFPMIASAWELEECKRLAHEVREELQREGVPMARHVPLGVMIETPAAAVMSDELARQAEFFSIGTNDLTQYTLAADRQHESLGRHYDAHHPAVLRLVRLVVENAHKNGVPVCICGELAADLELTETFLLMGVDELSVPPARILELRRRVREIHVAEARQNSPFFSG